MAVDIGTGTTFTFGTTAIALTLTSIKVSGVKREARNVSHLGSTNGMSFVPADLYDAGEIQLEGLLDAQIVDEIVTKVGAAAETGTITFPDAATWAATVFLMDFELGVPLEEEMTFSMTLKVSGDITGTP